MNEQWIVLVQGGGSIEYPDELRACGPFSSRERAEEWLVLGPITPTKYGFQPQIVQIESLVEF